MTLTLPTRLALARLAFAGLLGATMSIVVPAIDPAPASAQQQPGFQALSAPQRLLDTRGNETADGRHSGGGPVRANSTYALQVGGRVGLPATPAAVMLNVTVAEPAAHGHVTVYPCDRGRPNASSLNYAPGGATPNAVIATPSADGQICLYSHAATHLIVDASGWFPDGDYHPLPGPRRLLDTRPGAATADDRMAGVGQRGAGTVIELPVAGRVGLGDNPASVALNVTVAQPQAAGHVTVFPCDRRRPNASNVNYVAGQTIPNLVVSRVDPDGRVCLFTSAAAHLIVDVSGALPQSTFRPLDAPQRVLDTRPGQDTADGQFKGWGPQPRGSSLQLRLGGRVDIPADASGVVLNVTAVAPQAPGYVAAHPRGTSRPTASNVNYAPGEVVANAVVARLGRGGDVCLFTLATSDLVIDVAGWLTGPPPPTEGGHCPAVRPNDTGAADFIVENPAMHRAAGTDRIAVLGCNSEGRTVQATPADVVAWANEVVTPWYERVSRGAYRPVFAVHPARVITQEHTFQCEQEARRTTHSPFTNVMVYDASEFGGGHGSPGFYMCDASGCRYPHALLSEPPSVTGRQFFVGGGAVLFSQRTVVHEIGHTIHWPHSFIGPSSEYDNPVDVMSGEAADFKTFPDNPESWCERASGGYSFCHAQNTLAFNRAAAGWVGGRQVAMHLSGRAHYRLDRPMGDGVQVVAVPDPSANRRMMTVEARPADRHDRFNAKAGVAVHLIDQSGGFDGLGNNRRQRQARGEPNGWEHVLAPGESLTVHGVTVRALQAAGDGYLVSVTGTYRAPSSL